MNFVDMLSQEVQGYEDLIDQVPFNDYVPKKNFLRVYRLNYKELYKYVNTTPFPVDTNKLLKLTISLGNLIKSLQLDEEMYNQQHQQQAQFNNKLGLDKTRVPGTTNTPSTPNLSSSSNPFESPKHYINSTPLSNQPIYQIKFLKNLLLILKNFDIGHVHRDVNQSSTTLSQHLSSPIKLNSKQLLIEKLEININLDTLFIYKTLLSLLIRVFETLKSHLLFNQELGLFPNSAGNSNDASLNNGLNSHSNRNSFEQSSIFSTTSATSNSSDSITTDEYFKVLSQILTRISNGLIEPLLKYLLEFVGSNVSNEFEALITSL